MTRRLELAVCLPGTFRDGLEQGKEEKRSVVERTVARRCGASVPFFVSGVRLVRDL
jgi:hypothetical protein